ncbi:tetratricopeptide repeat protein [Planctomycetota bacterium]
MAVDHSEQPTKKLSNSSDFSEQGTIAMPAPDKFPELFQPWYPGQIIEGLYRIEEEIARGGMGVVHKATDLATNDFVVIKSLLPQIAQIDEYKKRFIREAEEWVALGAHPNIVRAYTAHEIAYLPRLVLEYIDGCSVDDLLAEEELPSIDRALDIAVQICWGMAYAHDKELIHRDLKPANVLIAKDGTVKVTDFGLVKHMLEEAEKQLAASDEVPPMQTLITQGIMGTPEYIAPEQWREAATQSSDIYAFGIILYEMFCGQRPFDFSHLAGYERITAYQTAHCKEPLPSPGSIRREIPEPIAHLIHQCLEKDPNKRPATFRSITSAINKIAKQLIGESFRLEPALEELDRHEKLDQANGYLRLGTGCEFRGDYSKALDLYNKAFAVFNALNYRAGISNYYLHRGSVYWLQSDFDLAMDMYQKSLEISNALGDQAGIGKAYHNMGIISVRQAGYDRALAMFQKSVEIMAAIGDKASLSSCYLNMGNIFGRQNDYDQAMEMYQKSLEISETLANQEQISRCYLNIGIIYKEQDDLNRAMEMYQKSLKIKKAIGDQSGICTCYVNMGNLFYLQKNYDQALEIYQRGLEIMEVLGDKTNLSSSYLNIGIIYKEQGNINRAMEMYQKSLGIAESLQDKTMICSSLFEIGQVYLKLGQNARALEHLNQSLEIMIKIGHSRQEEVKKLIADIQGQAGHEVI